MSHDLSIQQPLLRGVSHEHAAIQPVVKRPLAETAIKIGLFILFAGMIGVAVTLSPSIQAHIGKMPAIVSGAVTGLGFILTVTGLAVDHYHKKQAVEQAVDRKKPIKWGFLTLPETNAQDVHSGEAYAYRQGKRMPDNTSEWRDGCCRRALKDTFSAWVGNPKRDKVLSKASLGDLNNQVKEIEGLSLNEKLRIAFAFNSYDVKDFKQKLDVILKDNPNAGILKAKIYKMFCKERAAGIKDGSIQVDTTTSRAEKQVQFNALCDQSLDDESFLDALNGIFHDDLKIRNELFSTYETLQKNHATVVAQAELAGLERIKISYPNAVIRETHFNDMGNGKIECFMIFKISENEEIYIPVTVILDVRQIEGLQIEFFELVHEKPNPSQYFWNADRAPRDEMTYDMTPKVPRRLDMTFEEAIRDISPEEMTKWIHFFQSAGKKDIEIRELFLPPQRKLQGIRENQDSSLSSFSSGSD